MGFTDYRLIYTYRGYRDDDNKFRVEVSDRDPNRRFGTSNNGFTEQRSLQDNIIRAVRPFAGIPTGWDAAPKAFVRMGDFALNWNPYPVARIPQVASIGMSVGTEYKGLLDAIFDPNSGLSESILPNIALLTKVPADKTGLGRAFTTRDMMLALYDVSDVLPSGLSVILDKVGGGSEELRTNLQAALLNPAFLKFIASDENKSALSADSFGLGDDYLDTYQERFGLSREDIIRLTDSAAAKSFQKIADAGSSLNTAALSGVFQGDMLAAVYDRKLEMIAEGNPLRDLLAKDEKLKLALFDSYLTDEKMSTGFNNIFADATSSAQLAKMLENPQMAELFPKIVEAIGKDSNRDFGTLTSIATAYATGTTADLKTRLSALGIETPNTVVAAVDYTAPSTTDTGASGLFNMASGIIKKITGFDISAESLESNMNTAIATFGTIGTIGAALAAGSSALSMSWVIGGAAVAGIAGYAAYKNWDHIKPLVNQGLALAQV